MTTITRDMVATATEGLLQRGYTLRQAAADADLVWLQAPGPMPGSPWWPICRMTRTEVWNLICDLYEQEVSQ